MNPEPSVHQPARAKGEPQPRPRWAEQGRSARIRASLPRRGLRLRDKGAWLQRGRESGGGRRSGWRRAREPERRVRVVTRLRVAPALERGVQPEGWRTCRPARGGGRGKKRVVPSVISYPVGCPLSPAPVGVSRLLSSHGRRASSHQPRACLCWEGACRVRGGLSRLSCCSPWRPAPRGREHLATLEPRRPWKGESSRSNAREEKLGFALDMGRVCARQGLVFIRRTDSMHEKSADGIAPALARAFGASSARAWV